MVAARRQWRTRWLPRFGRREVRGLGPPPARHRGLCLLAATRWRTAVARMPPWQGGTFRRMPLQSEGRAWAIACRVGRFATARVAKGGLDSPRRIDL